MKRLVCLIAAIGLVIFDVHLWRTATAAMARSDDLINPFQTMGHFVPFILAASGTLGILLYGFVPDLDTPAEQPDPTDYTDDNERLQQELDATNPFYADQIAEGLRLIAELQGDERTVELRRQELERRIYQMRLAPQLFEQGRQAEVLDDFLSRTETALEFNTSDNERS